MRVSLKGLGSHTEEGLSYSATDKGGAVIGAWSDCSLQVVGALT